MKAWEQEYEMRKKASPQDLKGRPGGWSGINGILKSYNWIHAYPNMAVVVHALWYSEGSFLPVYSKPTYPIMSRCK